MRHNLLTKILVLVLALLVLIPNMGLGVFAADDGPTNEGDSDTPTESFDVSGSKKASPNLLVGDKRETTVTLSLPSAEYKNQIDVVLVIDSSSSTDLGEAFIEEANELFSNIVEKNPGVELKVGIVLFTGRGNDAIKFVSGKEGKNFEKLTVYNEDSKDIIEKCFDIMNVYSMSKDDFRKSFGRGSGPHAGLDMADEWLAEDTEVDDNQKYVVLMTDGKGYIWNDDNNVPTTMYSQYYQWKSGVGSSNVASEGKVTISQTMGYNKKSYYLDVLDPAGSNIVFYDSYEALYALNHKELTGVNEWDQKCTYAIDTTTPSGNVVKHPTTNGVDLFGDNNYAYWYEWIPDEAWKGVTYLEMNPYPVIDNKDGTYTFDTSTINPRYYQYHFDCLQKGLYKAGHLWTDMGKKYNCAVVTYDSSTGGGLELVEPFKEWIRKNSKFSAKKTNAAEIGSMFDNIDNDIRYMVSKGVVTDKITDNFDLKNPDKADGFRMTYNSEDLTVTFADDVWSFDDGNYTVTYDADSKTITWTINVPVENLKPVTLSYDLLLTEESAKTSKFYDTNQSAVLAFTSTDGKKNGTFTFEKPNVAYIKLIDINVEKVWEDYDDQDGIRPDKITVQLLGDEKPVDDGVLTKEGQWKFTFSGVPDSTVDDEKNPTKLTKIKYTIAEKDVIEGYTSGDPVGTVEKGFTITNTHEPEFSFFIAKIWDDEQDADGVRPESVTVNLLANGEPIDTAELGDFNMWTASYTVPFYDADGEPIEYTVTEEPVEGYEKPVIVFDPEYSVYLVTNKHEVKEPPKTDDATNQWFWAGMMVSSMALIAVIFYLKRKQDEE